MEGKPGEAAATIVATLPADARLAIDGHPTTSTSGTRVFSTPPLEPGMEYSYTLTAQVVRNGTTQTVTKQVTVRAGEESRVTLEDPAASSVASR
jgi:uncharacterized protein (TIGR03000 family)